MTPVPLFTRLKGFRQQYPLYELAGVAVRSNGPRRLKKVKRIKKQPQLFHRLLFHSIIKSDATGSCKTIGNNNDCIPSFCICTHK